MTSAGRPGAAEAVRPREWALPRFTIIVLGLAGLFFAVGFIKDLQLIIAPVFLAFNLVIVGYPVQAWLVRRRVPAAAAAVVTVLLVLSVVAAFFALTGWSIAELVLVIPEYSDELDKLYRDLLAGSSSLGLTPEFVKEQMANFDVNQLAAALREVLSNATLVVTLVTTAIMATFFIVMDSLAFPRRMTLASGVQPRFVEAMNTFAVGVRRYWVVATVFGLIVAALDVVALIIIGVPLALVWGVLAFLTNYIPNIGFVIGLVPPAIMALIEGGWWDALWVVIAYSLLNFVIQAIIQPKFTGQSVGVTPFISFLSLLFWVWVLGWFGALLALPATLLVKALLVDVDPRARWINLLVASDVRAAESPLLASPSESMDTSGEESHAETVEDSQPGLTMSETAVPGRSPKRAVIDLD